MDVKNGEEGALNSQLPDSHPIDRGRQSAWLLHPGSAGIQLKDRPGTVSVFLAVTGSTDW